jgi:hypothetical protein
MTTPTKKTSHLSVRVRGRDAELVCTVCAFTLTLPLRSELPSDCLKCGASWRER